MKFNFGKRVILFIYWLASMIVLAMLALPGYVRIASDYVFGMVPEAYLEYVSIALLAIYLLLSLGVLCMVFKRNARNREDRGFITVDSADTGKVRIAISAIEHMVKQAAGTVDGIADMKIAIKNADDAIAIHVNVNMVSGAHVPTLTMNMQRAIRQYVEMNCGVAVQSVSINIQSVINPGEGGKKGKRSEVKNAIQPVQEDCAKIETPAVVAEELPVAMPVEESSVEIPVVEEETVSVSEETEESVGFVDTEDNEEKEN